MEWLSGILGAGAVVASGGIFGMIGSVVGVVAKHYQEKARQVWEEKKWKNEQQLLELNMRVGQQETENEIALASTEGSWNGLSTSLQADASLRPTSGWATDVKALFRPFLTTLLWIIAAWVFYKIVNGDLKAFMGDAEIKEIVQYMVYTVFFTASTATTWWFGDRALTPPHMKHR